MDNTRKPTGARGSAPDDPAAARRAMNPGDVAPAGTPGTGEAPCPRCGGSGRRDGALCGECGGSGVVIQEIGGA